MARIDIVLPDLRAGGFEKVRVLLANEFRRLGHDVSIVLMQQQGELLERLDGGIQIVDLKVARGRKAVRALARQLCQRKPDAVLAGLWPLTTVAALARLFSRHDCRLVLSEHNHLSRQYQSWGRIHNLAMRASLALAHRLADASVGVSRGVAADIARLALLPAAAVTVINNPARLLEDAQQGAVDQADEIWGKRTGSRIITVGSLKAQKNQSLLLRAFAGLDRPQSRLMLVGDGVLKAELERQAAVLGLADRVIFAGYRADPAPFYKTADLFVLSSDYEGMPNVICEALSFGLPIVSTACPSGPDEILENGRYGTLVPVGDEAALAAAIADGLDNPPDSSLLKAKAENLSINATAQKYLDVLLPLQPPPST